METKHITQPLDDDARQADQRLRPGVKLADRYLIQDTVGEGGMGAVYRARDLHFPNVLKLVAVKEMVITTQDPEARQHIIRNFEREANILATLNHPAIPKIYDYFSIGNHSYLVLDFVHGKDLDQIVSETEGFLPEAQVLQWALELCDVLIYLHGHKPDPIIFRDMKPSNVMIKGDGHVVLVDFGIAKKFQAGQRGTMIGTEGYSPPEQYRGEASTLADIYSLGATLHHVLTKRDPRLEPPFSFGDRPIRQINPSVSIEFASVIEKALQYEPKDRYQTVEEMREALLGAARKTGLLNHLPSGSTAFIKQGSIKPLWTFQCEDELRSSPIYYNGTVYIGSYDHNLYAIQADDGKFLWKYATDGGIASRPAVADGQIFFGSEDHRLHVVDARSGRILWTHFADGPVRSSPRIAEGHVFFGADDYYLYAVNIVSQRRAWRFQAAAAIRSTAAIGDNAVFVGCESGDFYSVDFRGELKWRTKAKRAVTSSPLLHNNNVYFTSLDGMLYALEAGSGWTIWRFRMGKGSISSPIMADDLLFFGSVDGHVYAVDIKSGREAWRYRTEHQVNGSGAIYRDALYIASVDGYLYCLEYRTGRLRWKFQTDKPITGTPAIYDGVVYIGSTDHRLYALLA